ncbi:HelD family protein [Parafrankia discariae]|uniref:HelD family protein n=1 Tax=Parafrankia discariae TaxID=365528 RepID=UPI0018A80E0B|nr:UvrD-helicase domain-containing protein [Parafrankia discariae]
MLHERLDGLRAAAAAGLAEALLRDDPEPGARADRDALVARNADQVARFDAMRDRLLFGRLDMADGEQRYIGRMGVLDPDSDYQPLLIDWRAPASRPFYLATGATPLHVARRRHIRTVGRRVTHLDDELFDPTTLGGGVVGLRTLDGLGASADDGDGPGEATRGGLVGEATLLATLGAHRTGRMRDIVATIQAEQDRIIRSEQDGVLVVEGGPGTGKTTVALHRAAYLLYSRREQLSKRGVLIVGPNPAFLRYIEQVLPSLGETGVLLSTVGDLFPGVRARRAESTTAAEIKGRSEMVDILAAAVRDRQRLPDTPLEITVADGIARLDETIVVPARAAARLTGRPHNHARSVFVREVITALTRQIADRYESSIDEVDIPDFVDDFMLWPDTDAARDALGESDEDGGPGGSGTAADGGDWPSAALAAAAAATDRPVLDSADLADLRRDLRSDPRLAEAIDGLWPLLTPQALLADLFASPDTLSRAAPGLSDAERAALRRAPDGASETGEGGSGGWTPADTPLLDEAAELLGDDPRAAIDAAVAAHLERQQRVDYAGGVLDILSRGDTEDPDGETLMAADVIDADRFGERQEEVDTRSTAERAAADRGWAFGHVIVDEAQELSPMAWRMVMRRCPTRSMTLVGDVAQTGDAAGSSSWEQALDPFVGRRFTLERLTVNYRTGAEIMDVAGDVLAAQGRGLRAPRSVRRSGHAPWRLAVDAPELVERLQRLVRAERAAAGGGRLAVIVPRSRRDELASLAETDNAGGTGGVGAAGGAGGSDADPERPIVVLTVRESKGLEFDAVIVVEPERILAESPRGAGDLYVALTRPTNQLGVVHVGELPAVLSRLRPHAAGTGAPAAPRR